MGTNHGRGRRLGLMSAAALSPQRWRGAQGEQGRSEVLVIPLFLCFVGVSVHLARLQRSSRDKCEYSLLIILHLSYTSKVVVVRAKAKMQNILSRKSLEKTKQIQPCCLTY